MPAQHTPFESIREIIADWSRSWLSSEDFSGVYVFGSLIHRDGRHFIAAGSTASDVDLLIRFSDKLETAIQRTSALSKLRPKVEILEHAVAKALNRTSDEAIFSILPLTNYEIRQCIHKGHDPKLLTDNIFFDISRNETVPRGLSVIADYHYHYENLEPFSVMKLCQKYRNHFLSTNLLGKFKQMDFNDAEPLPKELMRSSAILRFFDGDREDASRRTDLEEGATYLFDLVKGLEGLHPQYKTLREKLSSRSFSRAKAEALSPEDMLLLNEVLFDRAKSIVIPSVRDAIREMLEKQQLNGQ